MEQIKIIGSYRGRARQDLPKLVKLAESGIFNLSAAVSRKCKFKEANEAYQDLNKGSIIGRACGRDNVVSFHHVFSILQFLTSGRKRCTNNKSACWDITGDCYRLQAVTILSSLFSFSSCSIKEIMP